MTRRCCLAAALCWAAFARGADWPQFRGTNASGVSDATKLPVEFGPDRNVIWKVRLPFGHSSPVIHGDLVYLWVGPGERQVLVALDKKTGHEVWRHEEPGGHGGLKKGDPWVGSWSTPVVAKIGDHEELILSVPKKLKGFDPKTGKELWHCDGLTDLVYTSPVV